MNPAIIIIILAGCVALWFLASALYKPIGTFLHKIGKDAMDEINGVDDEKDNKEKFDDKGE